MHRTTWGRAGSKMKAEKFLHAMRSFFCLHVSALNPIILLTLLLGFTEPARTAEPAASLRIVCLGDSITQGRGDHSGGGADR